MCVVGFISVSCTDCPPAQCVTGFWTCFFSRSQVPCFVCSGSSQWSVRKAGVDLTDHPWVMMMRGLLLLKPQEVRVCSCRGSSVQVSSPSKNSLKTELLTYWFVSVRTLLCSASTAPPKSNSNEVISLLEHTEVLDVFILRWIITNNTYKVTLFCSLESRGNVWNSCFDTIIWT